MPTSEPAPTSKTRIARRPAIPATLDDAPVEVREFLDRVLAKLPEGGQGLAGYRFEHWERPDKPTDEAVGIKANAGLEPEALIACVMDVDDYEGRIAHVERCRAIADSDHAVPGRVRFVQSIRIPGISTVQQKLVLVDAGTLRGYRIAYWYLLKDETRELDPKDGARSEFNVGAWLAAPGVVGYALSSWPRRDDVNALQWASLTAGADALARSVIERNIDGMAAWAMTRQGRTAAQSDSPP